LIGASLADADDDILLISRRGQAIRFAADDQQLRPMGRATSGVTGMKFRSGDALLSLSVIPAADDDTNADTVADPAVDDDPALAQAADQAVDSVPPVDSMPQGPVDTDPAATPADPVETDAPAADPTGLQDQFVVTVTDGGYAKRTAVGDYRRQGRGGLGVKAMKLVEDRGSLVGGLIVVPQDQIMAIKTSGQIIRSSAGEIPVQGRDAMGVKFVALKNGERVGQIALYPEAEMAADSADPVDSPENADAAQDSVTTEDTTEAAATPAVTADGESAAGNLS
jgi:DNA gyrase subunit A